MGGLPHTRLQVVVDEAHHTVANTYKAILEGLGFIGACVLALLVDTAVHCYTLHPSLGAGSLHVAPAYARCVPGCCADMLC